MKVDRIYHFWYIYFVEFSVELLDEAVDFILSLSVKMQAKVQRTISLLKSFGYKLPEPHSRKIIGTKNLFELRIKLGSDICRLFYFYWKDKIYLITSGYIKKSNKLDKKQLNKALSLMNHVKKEENND